MDNLTDQTRKTVGHKASVVKRMVMRVFSFVFIRRLATKPHPGHLHTPNHGTNIDLYIFEWQKMPTGYRWF